MNTKELYIKNNRQISRITTRNYSTSFSMAVKMLNSRYRWAIYSIYGFVRYADEIVDTLFDFPQSEMLDEFVEETYRAIDRQISMNPIIDSFQQVVNKFNIEKNHIDAFIESMRMDLYNAQYDKDKIRDYIYGSAEVVGLMCLRVFYKDDDVKYELLKHPARKLGEAFQKVNFLRDIKSDFYFRGRTYFPGIIEDDFIPDVKTAIEEDIKQDFDEAYTGIKELNKDVRFGVYLAYIYYLQLFKKLKKKTAGNIMDGRIRIPNSFKLFLMGKAFFNNTFNFI
jgi:phytoene/squalene synthetase